MGLHSTRCGLRRPEDDQAPPTPSLPAHHPRSGGEFESGGSGKGSWSCHKLVQVHEDSAEAAPSCQVDSIVAFDRWQLRDLRGVYALQRLSPFSPIAENALLFIVVRIARERQAKSVAQARAEARSGRLGQNTASQGLAGLAEIRIVEQIESLQRRVRTFSLANRGLELRRVKVREKWKGLHALEQDVHPALVALRTCGRFPLRSSCLEAGRARGHLRPEALAADVVVQQPRYGQGAVPNQLRRQPEARLAR